MEQQARRNLSLRALADLLEALSESKIQTPEDLVQPLSADSHPDVFAVLSNVHHYLADADIRRDDPEYRMRQDRDMANLIAALRRGAGIDELLQYNFL